MKPWTVRKPFLLFFIVGAAACALLYCWPHYNSRKLASSHLAPTLTPNQKFIAMWTADLQRLHQEKKLHKGMNDLKDVRFKVTSPTLKNFVQHNVTPFRTSPHGHYNLEVFMDQIEGGGVVVQYDLVDLKSGNTVWELGRTFPTTLK